jgi:hypothetical protein
MVIEHCGHVRGWHGPASDPLGTRHVAAGELVDDGVQRQSRL